MREKGYRIIEMYYGYAIKMIGVLHCNLTQEKCIR